MDMWNQTRLPREARNTLQGQVAYTYGPAGRGGAAWQNVSRTGAALRLGRYLRPGRVIRIHFDAPLVRASGVAAPARVVWSRQVDGAADFIVGLYVRRDTPEQALAWAALVHEARQAAQETAAYSRKAVPVWTGFAADVDNPQEQAQPRYAPRAV